MLLPLTDSTEPERQGQRQDRGFLWISESGIPVLGNSSECGPKWGFSKENKPLFAQPVDLLPPFFAFANLQI
jgi:hypothetical protein